MGILIISSFFSSSFSLFSFPVSVEGLRLTSNSLCSSIWAQIRVLFFYSFFLGSAEITGMNYQATLVGILSLQPSFSLQFPSTTFSILSKPQILFSEFTFLITCFEMIRLQFSGHSSECLISCSFEIKCLQIFECWLSCR